MSNLLKGNLKFVNQTYPVNNITEVSMSCVDVWVRNRRQGSDQEICPSLFSLRGLQVHKETCSIRHQACPGSVKKFSA